MSQQVLQPKCLCLTTGAHRHIGNRQIHGYLRVPFYADHIRSLTKSSDSKLADMGKPSVWKLSRYYTRVLTLVPSSASHGRPRTKGHLRPTQWWPSQWIVPSTVQLSTFQIPWLRVFLDFSSVIGQTPGYNAKMGHGPQSPPPQAR